MPLPDSIQRALRKLGWAERIFIALVAIYLVLIFVAPSSGWVLIIQLCAFFLAMWIAVRLLRFAARHAIWRLRNRLIVTYLFIGGVPILLIGALVGLTIYAMASQFAVFLVTSELDRRVESLRSASQSIVRTDAVARPETMRHMAELFYADYFPGITIILRTPNGIVRYPANSKVPPPPAADGNLSGIVNKDGAYYAWSHESFSGGDVTVLAPMGPDQLSRLVPNLGSAELLDITDKTSNHTIKFTGLEGGDIEVQASKAKATALPPAMFRFDSKVAFAAITPVSDYLDPKKIDRTFLLVNSRLSAVYEVLFTRKSDYLQALFPILISIASIAFLIVEIVSLVVGITMTRTITGAVHHIYEGTQRVMHGDFGHRIERRGRDQLGELGHSFNLMTERIESLLDVAKEKERLQSEIEIAREVQNQLYPKKVPDARTIRLNAVCKPARMVSGDYFDYECIRDTKIALAIGDVAGKGISAALLMATLQSALRTELRGSNELAMAVGDGPVPVEASTSSLVSHLNEQLHAYTSPEKYATFFLGIYDEVTSKLRYTNAGHLPPILVREGVATRLNVDGTVVGAFPFARYDESEIELKSGDLLVCFTDGVSEPENEYGEMFGEERLMDMVVRNAHLPDAQIIETIITAVEQWTGTPELQDDMTLMLARRQ